MMMAREGKSAQGQREKLGEKAAQQPTFFFSSFLSNVIVPEMMHSLTKSSKLINSVAVNVLSVSNSSSAPFLKFRTESRCRPV